MTVKKKKLNQKKSYHSFRVNPSIYDSNIQIYMLTVYYNLQQ